MGDDDADSTTPKAAATPDPVLAAIGARVREVRLAKGMGVTETATAAGLGKGHLWRVEAGNQNYSVKILVRVAAALDADLGELLAGVRPEGASAETPAGRSGTRRGRNAGN